eukprot:86666-Alexandrium_andersonii.AAC.1
MSSGRKIQPTGAADRAVWPIGRSGTAAPSGWILGPELALTRHLSARLGVPTYACQQIKSLELQLL